MNEVQERIARLRPKLWWLVPGALAVTLIGQVAVAALTPAPVPAEAVWAFRPRTLAEASAKAELIIRAEVTSVRAGDDLVATFGAGAPARHEQTQRITVHVTKVLKGVAQVGDDLTIFQLGGMLPGVAVERFTQDDPKYVVGEDYILLLRRQQTAPSLLITVAPEGRYRVEADGSVQAMAHNPITADLAGKPAALLEARLKQP